MGMNNELRQIRRKNQNVVVDDYRDQNPRQIDFKGQQMIANHNN